MLVSVQYVSTDWTVLCWKWCLLYAKLTCELIEVEVSTELECEVGFLLDEGFVVIMVV